MPIIIPKSPIAEAKISIIKILTKRAGFAASEIAAPEPTIPENNGSTCVMRTYDF